MHYCATIIYANDYLLAYCPRRFHRLRFKNVKHSDHGRYSCLISGFTENGVFSKWRNFTVITYKRSEATGNGKSLKLPAPVSLSHRKDGAKPKFINRLFMDNNVALLVDDILTLSCPFESKKQNIILSFKLYIEYNQLKIFIVYVSFLIYIIMCLVYVDEVVIVIIACAVTNIRRK